MNAKIISILLAASALNGCATHREWFATGGSRSDGTVKLSMQYGALEIPETTPGLGMQLAAAKCGAWGYSSAEPFGGITKICQQTGNMGCLQWLVTAEFQCTGAPTTGATQTRGIQSAPVPQQIQSASVPVVQSVAGETKWKFNAERIAQGSGCTNNPVGTLSGNGAGLETYSFVCTSGDVLSVRCEYGNCRALK